MISQSSNFQLDQSKTCVDFRGDRWYPIANTTREHKIRVYDYYEPGKKKHQIICLFTCLFTGYDEVVAK